MPPERRPPDDPREWLNRARSNLVRAQATLPGVYLEDLCFDAQQAAEKAIKAVLIARGVDFPPIHDLAGLLTILGQTGETIPPAIADAARLTRFAVATRYPGVDRAGHGRGAPTGRGDRRGGRRVGGCPHRTGVGEQDGDGSAANSVRATQASPLRTKHGETAAWRLVKLSASFLVAPALVGDIAFVRAADAGDGDVGAAETGGHRIADRGGSGRARISGNWSADGRGGVRDGRLSGLRRGVVETGHGRRKLDDRAGIGGRLRLRIGGFEIRSLIEE